MPPYLTGGGYSIKKINGSRATYQANTAAKTEATLRCCPLLSVSQNRTERQDMNETQKKRLDNLTEAKPETAEERHIFVVNSEQLYKSIWAAQYHAIAVTAEELIAYLDKRINEDSFLKDYIFVPCLTKKSNESLYTFFDREGIRYSRQGWTLGEIATKAALDKITQANKPKAAEDFPTAYTHKPHSATAYIDTLLSEDIKKLQDAGNRKTGFKQLDKQCKGLYSGLYVLAATSSLGKTTLALQIADNLAEAGHDVLFFSLEQSRLELITKSFSRLIKQETGETVTSLTLRMGADQERLKAAELYKSKLGDRMNIIEGNFNCDADYIAEYIKSYSKLNNSRPVVFVDYLQIMQPPQDARGMTAKDATDRTITALKRLSRDYCLTIFVISSVNRANYMQPIDFESLKESGGIEYTADVIWGLQLQCLDEEKFTKQNNLKEKRDRIREAKAENPRQIKLVCLKNRYGISNFDCDFAYYPECDLYTQEEKSGFNPCYDTPFKKQPVKRI